MLDALLLLYCKKDSRKKKKIKLILNSIEFDETKREFKCQSMTKPDKKHIVFYSNRAQDWFCDCKAPLYQKYETFEDLEKRNQHYIKYGCIHIVASKIYLALLHKD